MARKTAAEKMENPPKSTRKMTDKGMMYISTPKEILTYIKRIPKGRLTTSKIIAEKLTKKYKVDFTCPLTTGIFISVVANFAEESKKPGTTPKIPYWRVIKPDGKLMDKYLGEKYPQKNYLQKEGFKIQKGRAKGSQVIKDFEKYLF